MKKRNAVLMSGLAGVVVFASSLAITGGVEFAAKIIGVVAALMATNAIAFMANNAANAARSTMREVMAA